MIIKTLSMLLLQRKQSNFQLCNMCRETPSQTTEDAVPEGRAGLAASNRLDFTCWVSYFYIDFCFTITVDAV